jgi:hypothetical protein
VIPGFASAERAWENKNPFESDCTCLEDDLYACPECGDSDSTKGECPNCHVDRQEVSDDTRREDYPDFGCPQHGYTAQDEEDDAREHDYESRMGY